MEKIIRQEEISRRLEKFYDSDSHRYRDAQWINSLPAEYHYQATRNILLTELKLSGSENILEIGCGPGTWTRELQANSRAITALDLSFGMISQARSYVANPKVSFIQGDFISVAFPDMQYDRIVSVRVLEYFKDKKLVLEKCYSLLNPGGRLVIITKSPGLIWKYRAKFYNRMKKYWTTTTDNGFDSPAQKGYDHLFWQELVSPMKLKKIAQSTGFKHYSVKPVLVRLPIIKNGLYEFPILNGKCAERYLDFALTLTKTVHKQQQICNTIACSYSESYMITCIK